MLQEFSGIGVEFDVFLNISHDFYSTVILYIVGS